MTRNPTSRPASCAARHRPCALPYHAPGRRVQWQRWSNGRWLWVRGTVLSHSNRTLTVLVDGGVRACTSCGPVVAEVAK